MARFRPVPLVRLLRDMMVYASTALDLGFYTLAFRDESASYEVVHIERLVEELWERAVAEASLAVRTISEAEAMISVFRVVDSLLRVTEAAGELAGLVLRGVEPPPLLREALLSGAEVTAPLRISGRVRVGELEDAGVDVVAVRRGSEWILNPGDDVVLEPGDVAIIRGSPCNVARVAGLTLPEARGGVVERETLRLKKLADVILDLGFYSILYGDEVIALHVLEMEHRLDDDMLYYYELVSKLGLSPQQEYALHKFAEAVENVSDAAAAMAAMVRAKRPVHVVIAAAEDQSTERILALQYVGEERVTLADTGLIREEVIVLAVRRGAKHWVPSPSPDTPLEKGDVVIVKTYAENLEEVIRIAEEHGLRPMEKHVAEHLA